jgi:MoxR-like ATPase
MLRPTIAGHGYTPGTLATVSFFTARGLALRARSLREADASRTLTAAPGGRTCYTPWQFPLGVIAIFPGSISDLQQRLADQHYLADRGLAVSLFLALRLKRPLFLEGEAGVGKTALAGAVAAALGTDLIRLQCYEGLDVGHALYEWDYARQLIELRILDASHTLNRETARHDLYGETFLIKRPLLQAIDPHRTRPAVLLIDEIDRADEEFEGFLLELLAEFQITIPELGTVRATEPPLVVLTSNRTREVHDALKRRCLYQWIEYPSLEKELAIVREHAPAAPARLAEQVTAMVQEMRSEDLYKVPGVSETIDWVNALAALDRDTLDADAIDETLGVVLKAKEDLETLRGRRAAELLDRAIARRASRA